jgi:TPP-dependent indolepyruvate ferredoxin oxidoreductase alpha subunit
MGGQACVFYGAAEFSRDTDLAIVADAANLARLRRAMDDLQAEVIAVPPCALKYLRRGHAIHFRCRHPEALRMRVDVMSKMRGVDAIPKLWKRRTTIELPDGTRCDLLSLPDLVQAKKTQRDKDWPMIRRLVEAHYFQNSAKPDPAQIRFWFQELRTPQLLVEVAQRHNLLCRRLVSTRPLLAHAVLEKLEELERALMAEESAERERDRQYWVPLRAELEKLRHAR